MLLIFPYTKFSTLESDETLISLSIVDASGEHVFCSALCQTSTETDANEYSTIIVLPPVGDSAERISLAEFVKKLSGWIESFNEPIQVATESVIWVWKYLVELLGKPGSETWPDNLAHQPILLNMNCRDDYDMFMEEFSRVIEGGESFHHDALDGAMANRKAWLDSEVKAEPEVVASSSKKQWH